MLTKKQNTYFVSIKKIANYNFQPTIKKILFTLLFIASEMK